MIQTFELTFKNTLGVYNALWDLGGKIVTDHVVVDRDNWLLTYRRGLRGMFARLLAVDRHFVLLHQFQHKAESVQGNPNGWVLECEYYAGIILFGMDSSLECFIFTINALGFAKYPNEFCNIMDFASLKKIGPKNILGGDEKGRFNPRPGYQLYFPQVVNLWKENKDLISTIFEYHDVTKHRSAVVQGGRLGELAIKDNPKQPASATSSASYTLQSLAKNYQEFMDDLLPIALEESAAIFGYTMKKVTKS